MTAIRARLIQVGIASLIPAYSVLPARFVFAVLTVCERLRLPARSALMRPFVPIAGDLELHHPDRNLWSWVAKVFPNSTSITLFRVEAYRQCCAFTEARSFRQLPPLVYDVWVRSLVELGRFQGARDVLAFNPALRNSIYFSHLAGHLDLIEGAVADGIKHIERAVQRNPSLLCAHQNLAARYPSNYTPTRLDRESGRQGLLFDAYNYIGQRVTHVGEGQLSAELYGRALTAQDRLRSFGTPRLSLKLVALLARLGIPFEDLRLLPVEWYTQVGHQGMLDMLFRMRDFGWWQGKVIFLMAPSAIANSAFQSLFEAHGDVVLTDTDPAITAELMSLQRWCGMNFNAFRLPSGEVVPWQEAGGKLMLEWDGAGRGHPPAAAFDRIFGVNAMLAASMKRWRRLRGMAADDWYVCIHMRDASHYGEVAGTGQTHRNSGIDEYLKAIAYVTSRGGWVVKLGGKRSPKLPDMPRVIDYARSDARSEIMDVHLIRHARFFIGTTSGLTNVAVSFGTPCALINCITTDAQLWGDRVRFILKRIKLRDGTEISQHQLTTTPWRWRVFGADVLVRYGATLVENSADEILEVVKEVEALADGKTEAYRTRFPDAEPLLDRWRQSLAFPHFYGAGQLSLYFLAKHRATLLPEHASQARESQDSREPVASLA